MKIFIIILFFLFTSHSEDFSSDSLIKKVESKYNRFAKNRFIALNELLKKLEKENIQLRRELAIEKNAAKEIVVQQKEVKNAASEFAIVFSFHRYRLFQKN